MEGLQKLNQPDTTQTQQDTVDNSTNLPFQHWYRRLLNASYCVVQVVDFDKPLYLSFERRNCPLFRSRPTLTRTNGYITGKIYLHITLKSKCQYAMSKRRPLLRLLSYLFWSLHDHLIATPKGTSSKYSTVYFRERFQLVWTIFNNFNRTCVGVCVLALLLPIILIVFSITVVNFNEHMGWAEIEIDFGIWF